MQRRNFLKAFLAAGVGMGVGAGVLTHLPSLPTALKVRPIISGLHLHTGEIIFLDELLAGKYRTTEVVVRGHLENGKWRDYLTLDKLGGVT